LIRLLQLKGILISIAITTGIVGLTSITSFNV